MFDDKEFTSRVRATLLGDSEEQAWEIVRAQERQGTTRQEMYDALTCLIPELRAADLDAEEDALFDVMDLLSGWSSR